MIWQSARVVGHDGARLALAFGAPEGCRRCAAGRGCGAGVFIRLLSRRETRVDLPGGLDVSPGQWVRVGIEPNRLARAAALHYGLPLLGFLAGALAGHVTMPGGIVRDLSAVGVGLAGFLGASLLVTRRLRPALNPVIERLSCSGSDTRYSAS